MLAIRYVSENEARKEILDYLEIHKEAYTSDIADALNLDIDLIHSVLKELKKEGITE